MKQIIWKIDKGVVETQMLSNKNNISDSLPCNNNKIITTIRQIMIDCNIENITKIQKTIEKNKNEYINKYSLLFSNNINFLYIIINNIITYKHNNDEINNSYYFNSIFNNKNVDSSQLLKISIVNNNNNLSKDEKKKLKNICTENNLSFHLILNSKSVLLIKKILYFNEFEKYDFMKILAKNYMIINNMIFFKNYDEWKSCDALTFKSFFKKKKNHDNVKTEQNIENFENFIHYLESSQYKNYNTHHIIKILRVKFNNNIVAFMDDLGFNRDKYDKYENLFNVLPKFMKNKKSKKYSFN